MRIAFLLTLFLSFFSTNTFCQDSLYYKSKWQIRPNYGINIPITKLLDGRIPDNLIEYADNSMYWQVLSVTCFFHKHWGVDFNFQGMTARIISAKADKFIDAIKADYEDSYYVIPSSDASYGNFNPISGDFERGFIGLIYRYEAKRFFIYPKFSIGVSSFYANVGEVTLKQKNSNNIVEVSYRPDNPPQDHFIIAPSAAFGYKLSKRFYFNVELMTSYYKTNVKYIHKVTDLNTKISKSDEITYNKDIFTLTVGGGFIFVIK